MSRGLALRGMVCCNSLNGWCIVADYSTTRVGTFEGLHDCKVQGKADVGCSKQAFLNFSIVAICYEAKG